MISEEFMLVVYIQRALLEKHVCSQKKVFANKVQIQGKSMRKHVQVWKFTIHLPKKC